jgi:5'-3' exonuclease
VKTEKELKPLLDLDILQYRCGFAADSQMKKEYKEQHPEATDEEVAAYLEDLDYTALALHNAKTVLEGVTERFSSEYKAYIQGEGNFRYDLATIKPYKGNRDKSHKPKYYKEIKDYLVAHWNAIEVHGMEADDAIGIEQFDNPDKYTVIVSTDKDMDMIPGWHFNWVKNELYYQTINEANLFLFYQMLVGDTVDNIQGINKIGPVRANKIIEENGRDLDKVRDAVKALYQQQYGEEWEKAYYEIANLLWIRRNLGEECTLL